jgi:hypothetical protein
MSLWVWRYVVKYGKWEMVKRRHDLELYVQTKKREIGVPRLMWIRLEKIANRDNDPKSTDGQLGLSVVCWGLPLVMEQLIHSMLSAFL